MLSLIWGFVKSLGYMPTVYSAACIVWLFVQHKFLLSFMQKNRVARDVANCAVWPFEFACKHVAGWVADLQKIE
jgi:hypothetical protein